VTIEEIAFAIFLCFLSGYAGYLVAYYQAVKVIVETFKEALGAEEEDK
jgi:hypothetical protein